MRFFQLCPKHDLVDLDRGGILNRSVNQKQKDTEQMSWTRQITNHIPNLNRTLDNFSKIRDRRETIGFLRLNRFHRHRRRDLINRDLKEPPDRDILVVTLEIDHQVLVEISELLAPVDIGLRAQETNARDLTGQVIEAAVEARTEADQTMTILPDRREILTNEINHDTGLMDRAVAKRGAFDQIAALGLITVMDHQGAFKEVVDHLGRHLTGEITAVGCGEG